MNAASPRPSWPERLLPLVCAAVGLCWFLAAGGGRTLNPTFLDWLGDGDLGQHVMGWLFFRNEGWGFPLGAVPGLLHPVGGSVAYTDANPWVAVLLKPFSPLLPVDFQYIGLWLGTCFALQGLLGCKVLEALGARPLQRVLGAALFVMAPPLLHRMGHDTLCAHWLLLGMLWLHLRPVPDGAAARRSVGWAGLFNVLAAGIHPYLSAMVFLLTLALLARLFWVERQLPRAWLVGTPVAVLGAVGGLFYLFGYIGQPTGLGAVGFGFFSADLLAFFNSMGQGRLPPIPAGPGQYEGYGYLGGGVLALGVASLVAWRVRTPREPLSWRPLLPLLVAASGFFLFALSSKMTVAGTTFLSMRSLITPLEPALSPLRSSGRFIWLPGYVLTAGVLALTLRVWRARPAVATGLLLAAVAVQVADAKSVWEGHFLGDAKWPRLQAPQWSLATAPYRHLALYPPYNSAEADCGKAEYRFQHYLAFADLAYRQRLTYNSGSLARTNHQRVQAYCDALKADLEAGRFARDTIYVVHPSKLGDFTKPGSSAVCGQLEGQHVCVTAEPATPLRDFLAGSVPVAGASGH